VASRTSEFSTFQKLKINETFQNYWEVFLSSIKFKIKGIRMENQKIELKEIYKEHWKYILFESIEKELYIEIPYSPISFFQASMLIKLSKEEIKQHFEDNTFLIKLSEEISYHFNRYTKQSLSYCDFSILYTKNS
jgi:hypothetical protein